MQQEPQQPEQTVAADPATVEPQAQAQDTLTSSANETDPGSNDKLAALEEKLRIAESKAVEHHEAWLRAKAETENVRRRAEEEVAKAARFAAEKFANALLPVRDSLEAALAIENQSTEKLREGVELTLRQMHSAFEGAGIAQEDPLNCRFDPNRHQAISAVPSEAEPNTVINVLQKGYLLHDRVLRPAMVVVSRS